MTGTYGQNGHAENQNGGEQYCSRCGVTPTVRTSGYCEGCEHKVEVDAILEKNNLTREQVSQVNVAERRQIFEPVAETVTQANWKGLTDPVVAPVGNGDIPIKIKSNGNGASTATVAAPETVSNLSPSSTPSNGSAAATSTPYTYEDPGADWIDKLGEDFKVARDDADAAAPKFVDFPVELVKAAVKEQNQLTKRDVESVLSEFTMNVSLGQYQEDALSLVVTDINDKQGMKKARELRLVGKRERVRFDQKGAEIKEPYLRRVQFIDGIRRTVRQKFEACETHLLEQEQFEERELARIADEKKVERIADLLSNFEWMADRNDVERTGAATEIKLGYMTDDQWRVYRNEIATAFFEKQDQERREAEAKRLEDERLALENARLLKKNERVATLSQIGLKYDGSQFSFGDLSVEVTDVENAPDDSFARLVEALKPQIQAVKDAEAADAARVQEEAAEHRRLAAEAEAKRKTAQDELDRQESERKAEADRLAAEAEAKRLAPDKEKLVTYFQGINAEAVRTMPEFASPEAKALAESFFDALASLVNSHATTADRLGA